MGRGQPRGPGAYYPLGPFFGREYPGLKPGETPLARDYKEPRSMPSEALLGLEFTGPKGTYKILGMEPNYLWVQYLSGEWEGQMVKMAFQTHYRIQMGVQGRQEAAILTENEEADRRLDIWYDKYPKLYNIHYKPDMLNIDLLKVLESEYPELIENIDYTYERYYI